MTALAEVYVDESGSHAGSQVLSVGCYIFLKEKAEQFSEAWSAMLERERIPYFHMTDCANGQGIYKDWSMERRIAHEKELIALTKKYSEAGICKAINEQEFEEVLGERWSRSIGGPYTYLLRSCLAIAKDWAKYLRFEGQFVYYFEGGHRDQKKTNAVMDDIFARPNLREEYRYVSHSFVDKAQALPLQSADLLAWLGRNTVIKLLAGEERPRADAYALLRENDRFLYYDKYMLTAVKARLDGDMRAFDAIDHPHFFKGDPRSK